MPNLIVKQYDKNIFHPLEDFIKMNGWKYIGSGSYRTAYKRGNSVVKIPLSDRGFSHNIIEAYSYRKYRNGGGRYGTVFAPCRLLPSGCLLMPLVDYISYHNLPEWAQDLDSSQAGYYKGRIVGYDTASDTLYEVHDAIKWAGLDVLEMNW